MEYNLTGLKRLYRAMLLQAAKDIIHSMPGSVRYEEAVRFLNSEFAEQAAEVCGFSAFRLLEAAKNPDGDRNITKV